jgi:hypothetical protein
MRDPIAMLDLVARLQRHEVLDRGGAVERSSTNCPGAQYGRDKPTSAWYGSSPAGAMNQLVGSDESRADPLLDSTGRPAMRLSRRSLQVALGLLWLLDGALQLQPVMFTRRFASDIIAPAGQGQPAAVHFFVSTSAAVIHAHPLALDAAFASVQLLLGAGLLYRRTARVALAGSILWALGVWLFGEGLGGVLGSGATILTGAPGAVVFYALLGAAAWDRPGDGRALPPSPILIPAWAATWFGLGALELLPGSRSGRSIAADLTANVGALPSSLAGLSREMASSAEHAGTVPGALIAACCVLIGILGLRAGRWRVIAAIGAVLLGLGTWIFAEAFGTIGSGLATDPNSGPLLVLFALALWSLDSWHRAPARLGTFRLSSAPGSDRAA